jgi:predicted amidohydrolase
MKICAAQTRPLKGDIQTNIANHKKLIALAIDNGADLIVFPELSLTGYEPGLAKDLATTKEDKRLDEFQQISDANKITIGLGVPTKSGAGVLISMIFFQPGRPRQIYSKQQLHSDEFPYFVGGDNQIILTIDDIKIAPAICYESLQPDHSEKAHKLGAKMYVASVAKTKHGVDKAEQHYPQIAGKYAMTVLMANCVGHCDNFESAGKSAVWNDKGNLAGQLDDKNEGLLIFDTDTAEVKKKIL